MCISFDRVVRAVAERQKFLYPKLNGWQQRLIKLKIPGNVCSVKSSKVDVAV